MHFAIDVPNYGKFGDPALLVDLAAETEAAGWDGFFVWDHIVAGGRSPVADTWTVLSAASAVTNRIRLGPMVTPLARRRIPKVARETVTLDHLSHGRVTLGVGLGHSSDREFAALGDEKDPRARGELLDEGLSVLEGLWGGKPFSYSGDHLQVAKTTFRPQPVQSPRIPVWVAGMWPNKRPMRRAACWDGVFPIGRAGDLSTMLPPGTMADVVRYVRQYRTSQEPFDVVHAGLLTGHPEDDARTVQAYVDAGVTWWLEHFHPSRTSVSKLRTSIRRGPPVASL